MVVSLTLDRCTASLGLPVKKPAWKVTFNLTQYIPDTFNLRERRCLECIVLYKVECHFPSWLLDWQT